MNKRVDFIQCQIEVEPEANLKEMFPVRAAFVADVTCILGRLFDEIVDQR